MNSSVGHAPGGGVAGILASRLRRPAQAQPGAHEAHQGFESLFHGGRIDDRRRVQGRVTSPGGRVRPTLCPEPTGPCRFSGERALEIGDYILVSRETVREAARQFGVSKSTVHKDLTERLPRINPQMAADVKHVLDYNKSERHIRGGEATRKKFLERELQS